MANKRGVGTGGNPTQQNLATNVFGLFALHEKPVYRYDVKITGWTRSERCVDFTGKISNE